MRAAVSDARIAVYYPVETFQTLVTSGNVAALHENPVQKDADVLDDKLKNLRKRLFWEKIDYNFVDSQGIVNAVFDKSLFVGDTAYAAIVMPYMDVIPFEILKKLELFTAQGGCIV